MQAGPRLCIRAPLDRAPHSWLQEALWGVTQRVEALSATAFFPNKWIFKKQADKKCKLNCQRNCRGRLRPSKAGLPRPHAPWPAAQLSWGMRCFTTEGSSPGLKGRVSLTITSPLCSLKLLPQKGEHSASEIHTKIYTTLARKQRKKWSVVKRTRVAVLPFNSHSGSLHFLHITIFKTMEVCNLSATSLWSLNSPTLSYIRYIIIETKYENKEASLW